MPSSTDDQLSRDLQSLRIERTSAVPSSNRKKWATPLVLILATTCGVWVGYQTFVSKAQGSLFKVEVTFTEISTVSPAQGSVEVTSTGYVVPQIVAKVGSKITGRLSKVNVKEGTPVKAGDVLFELDPIDQKTAIASANAKVASAIAKVQAAKAGIAEVEQQFKRQKNLVQSGAAPSATADDLGARLDVLKEQAKAQEAEVTAARADVAALSVTLKQTTILAPVDGMPVSKPAQIGDVVSPDAPLVELVDMSSLLVETDVPEGRLGKIRIGGPVEIVLDAADGKRFRGVVAEFGPKINRSKATAIIKVRFVEPPADLKQDMAARVSFLSKELSETELKQEAKTVVPSNALSTRNGTKVVWVVEGEKVRMVPIEVGEAYGSGFVLRKGPQAGTRLVRDPVPSLADGQSVKEKGK